MTDQIVTDEMVTRAYRVLMEEVNPPYSVDVRRFTAEDINNGKLKRAIVRRALEAAISHGEEHRV